MDRKWCAECDYTGWKPIDPDASPRSVVACACRVALQNHHRLKAAGIPPQYQHCRLENFRAYNASLERALVMARQLVETYPAVPRRVGDQAGRGLFLEGQAGVGKTHLAAAVLTEVMQRARIVGVFYKTRDLLRLIRDSYNPTTRTTEAQILHPVLTADLLVIDDLGAERVTDWVDETMNLIVDTRYSECRLTLFTSNYPDIPDDTDPNSLLFRIGFRMRSRLFEMCEFVELDGADYRSLPPNGDVDDLRILWKQRRRALPLSGRGRPARAQLRDRAPIKDGKADLKWPGGRGGNT